MSDFIPSTKWRMTTGAWVMLFLVFLVGISASVATFTYVIMRPQHTVEGLAAPSDATFELTSPGYHVIYFAFQRTLDHKGIIRPAGYDKLQVSVADAEGKPLELEPLTDEYDYVWRYVYGSSAYGFTANSAGSYRLITEYPDGVEAQPVDLVVKQVYQNSIRNAFLAELLVLLITAVAAVVVIQFGRRQFQKSDEAAYYNALRAGAA